ncbi:MAG: hypothetical protein JW934_19420 [Anaerolineae bacterium]|nr:hypothetical protein [Anaerolineae bacterium]
MTASTFLPWRAGVRLRRGVDDDLIAYLGDLHGRRALLFREAARRAVRAGVLFRLEFWVERPGDIGRHDARVSVRFVPGEDDDVVAYLATLPNRRRSSYLRQVLRWTIESGQIDEALNALQTTWDAPFDRAALPDLEQGARR